MSAPLRDDFLVYRRDLPGGRTVMITLLPRGDGSVRGELHVERRKEPERRRSGIPPLVAEVVDVSREKVVAQLRAIADDEAELTRRLAAWKADQRPAP